MKLWQDRQPDRGSRVAAVWLSVFLLAITISPRIRLAGGDGEQPVDIRIQDLLIAPIVLYLLASRVRVAPLFKLWGWRLPMFMFGAFVALLLVIWMDGTISFRRIAFFGRGIEIFVVAAVAAGLYLRAGDRGMPTIIRTFHFVAVANFAWVAYQFVTGSAGTLLGGELGDNIQSYGPKLIGEPSSFGAGAFFAFVAALGVAELRSRYGHPLWSLALIAMGAAGSALAESRVAIAAVAFAFVLVLVLSNGRQLLNPIGVTFTVIGAVALAFTILPELGGRLSPEAVVAAFEYRMQSIWVPLLSAIGENPFLGVGPGGLIRPLPIEGHNVILRALLDYGLVVGTIFLALFAIVIVKSWRAVRSASEPMTVRLFSNLALIYTLALLVAGMFMDAWTAVMSSHLQMAAIGLFAAVNAQRVKASGDYGETLASGLPVTGSFERSKLPRDRASSTR